MATKSRQWYVERDRHEQNFGHPPFSGVAALEHTLKVHGSQPDDRMILEATNNIYGDGVVTGLRYGDLLAIARKLGIDI